MVVKVGVGDGYEVSSVRKIYQTIVSVLANSLVTVVVAMIDPYIGGELNGSGIAVFSEYLADLHVAYDDILLAQNRETNSSQGCKVLVRAHAT